MKDADLYPVIIRSLRLNVQDSTGRVSSREFTLDWKCDQNLLHRSFSPLGDKIKGLVRVDGWIIVENPRGKSVQILNHNFPGLAPQPLEIRVLEHSLPYPTGWQAGEMHCHSEFSSDPVEFGAPLELMQKTADSVGLDFVLCTDHSYDFHYRRERYLESCDPEENFQDYRKHVNSLNAAHPSLPTMVAGEEVSCGNHRGENVHLLVFGPDHFLPGLGDGGRRGFNNRPDFPLGEILDRIAGIPTFAAHPKAKIGWLERKVFRRGQWHDADVVPQRPASGREHSIRGVQFWNGHLESDYREGKSFWIRQLLSGNRLLPIAANDAHGDFNRNIGVKLPLFSLYQSRNHVFGKVRTVIPSESRETGTLRNAFLGDRCICTDGPFLEIAREGSAIRVRAKSSGDFGGLNSLALYGGRAGENSESMLKDFSLNGAMECEEVFPAPNLSYARAEVSTRNGRQALTSAVFLD